MVSFKFSTLLAAATLALLPAADAAKRGLAWPKEYQSCVLDVNHHAPTASDIGVSAFNPNVFLPGGKVDWIYNWHADKPSVFSSIPSFYAMQWDATDISKLHHELKKDGAGVLLGFNEPDNAGQANLSPEAAATLWKRYFEPIKAHNHTIKLITPAVTNAGAPGGLAWLDSFLSYCTGCHIDGVAIHWYGGWIDDFTAFVNGAKKYNKPIYLTEFGLDWDQYATVDSYTQFLPLAFSYLDNEPAVAKYAFFGAFYSGTGALRVPENAAASYRPSLAVSRGFSYLPPKKKKRKHATAPEPTAIEEPPNWVKAMAVDGDKHDHDDGEDDDEPVLKKLRIN
ncbi:hypothetical protein FRC04_002228 [Tulasnella sp. 424]|nr:hypothetical protein FRC04_002228 [Tulasnella sp. 424]